jgi:hypothetical protein
MIASGRMTWPICVLFGASAVFRVADGALNQGDYLERPGEMGVIDVFGQTHRTEPDRRPICGAPGGTGHRVEQ